MEAKLCRYFSRQAIAPAPPVSAPYKHPQGESPGAATFPLAADVPLLADTPTGGYATSGANRPMGGIGCGDLCRNAPANR